MSDSSITALQPSPSGPAGVPEIELAPLLFAHYAWVLRRHAWKIALLVLVCAASAYALSKHATPIYEASALIDFDRDAPMAVVGQDSAHGNGVSDIDQFISTQVRLIQSDTVLRPVAEMFHLVSEENLGTGSKGSTQVNPQAPIVLTRLAVNRLPNTYFLSITYRSPSSENAADVANAIAQSYLQTSFALRLQSSTDLSHFMERQLDEVRTRMEHSNQQLADFERQYSVVNPEEKTNILSARLLQLNNEFTAAQVDRVRKEVIWNSVKEGAVPAAEASAGAESLERLKQRLDEAEQKFAIVSSTYGTEYPEYKKSASELGELRRQVGDTAKDVREHVRASFQQAQRREQMLRDTVSELKEEYDRLNSQSYKYQQLKQDATADRTLYDELSAKVKEAGINNDFHDHAIRIVERARPGAAPISPTTRLNVAFAVLFSVILGAGLAIASDATNPTVRDSASVKWYLGIDVIGSLPAVKEPPERRLPSTIETGKSMALGARGASHGKKAGRDSTFSHYGEAIRAIRSTILLSDRVGRLRSILVTSAGPGEGKTTAVVNFAIAHAIQGNRTLIIDADLRRPSVHMRLNIPDGPGLSDILTKGLPYVDVVQHVNRIGQLYVITAGPPSHRAADLIGPRIADLLDQVAKEFDLVLIDAPSLLGFSDPIQMAHSADGVLIVTSAGSTRREALLRVVSTLTRVRANILGIVINRVSSDASTKYPAAYVASASARSS
jgi:polysaccharide biosynthesis transport protein